LLAKQALGWAPKFFYLDFRQDNQLTGLAAQIRPLPFRLGGCVTPY
jgi:hypothetical protein